MNESRFDTLIHALTDGRIARRALTRGLAGTVIAAGLASWSGEDLQAGKRRKRKRRKKRNNGPLENEFGCRNVGVACISADQCCSGICEGQRSKTCRAHDTGGCRIEDDSCRDSANPTPCVTSTGADGFCQVTTGNAGYCAFSSVTFDCTKDEDCIEFCGPQSACGVCADSQLGTFRFCAGLGECSLP